MLHLQSHIAFDSIALARRGARVTCVDFSRESLARGGRAGGTLRRDAGARRGRRAGAAGDPVRALRPRLRRGRRAGLDRGPRRVDARRGRPRCGPAGGSCSSSCTRCSSRSHRWTRCNSTSRTPTTARAASTSRAPTPTPTRTVTATATVEYGHSLGEVVTAAIAAGLRIDALHEHLDDDRDRRGVLDPARSRRPLPAAGRRRAAAGAVHAAGEPPRVNVVFLHGVAGSAATYGWLPEPITGGRHVVRLDFRGHGAAERTPGALPDRRLRRRVVRVLRAARRPRRAGGPFARRRDRVVGRAAPPGARRRRVPRGPAAVLRRAGRAPAQHARSRTSASCATR